MVISTVGSIPPMGEHGWYWRSDGRFDYTYGELRLIVDRRLMIEESNDRGVWKVEFKWLQTFSSWNVIVSDMGLGSEFLYCNYETFWFLIK